ncbi:MAG: retropepsin-like domain-containing protein [Bacteroidales bacterium]|nr:retropepsin-like domain-containing protein [Bacteroidales bacterium]
MKADMFQVELHIEMLEEGNYHTILYGTLGGIRLRMVLDTGASHSCIDAEIARTFFPDLVVSDNEGVNAGIGGNDFSVQIADFPDFTLGDYRQPMLTNLAVVDMSHINVAYRTLKKNPIQMILGNDFLIEHHAVIHYGENRLYFQ